MPIKKDDYLKELERRARKSHISRRYQLDGLEIAEALNDKKHKSLYIKLAKEYDVEKLREISSVIAENSRIKNKGAYFMWYLKNKTRLLNKKSQNKIKMEERVLTIGNKDDKKFLSKKTEEFDFKKFGKKEIDDIIKRMRKIMRAYNGIGLSANQVGIPYRFFIAEVPSANRDKKFYAVFNPTIEKKSGDMMHVEEGCLSVPGIYGYTDRHRYIVVRGFNKNGKPIKIKAWGLLAHVFQHEIDHLNGKLFTHIAKETYKTEAKSIKNL